MTDTDDDGGRSTGTIIALAVVGIMLLAVVGIVAIVVISAVIGGFVLNADSMSSSTAPRAEFTGSYDDGSVTITHDGGESADPSRLVISVGDTARGTWGQIADTSGPVRQGDSVTVDAVDPGEEVHMTYVDEDISVPVFTMEAPPGGASARLDASDTGPAVTIGGSAISSVAA